MADLPTVAPGYETRESSGDIQSVVCMNIKEETKGRDFSRVFEKSVQFTSEKGITKQEALDGLFNQVSQEEVCRTPKWIGLNQT